MNGAELLVGVVVGLTLGVIVLRVAELIDRRGIKEGAAERDREMLALRESHESYRMLTELMPEAVVVHCAGKLMYVNTAGLKLFGMDPESDWVGMEVMERVHPDYRRLAAERVRMTYEQGQALGRVEEVFLRMDGTPFDVTTAAAPVPYMGKPATILVVADITEQKQLQEQLAQGQKMEAIGQLAGGVAHDFNNVLTAIRGFAELHLMEHPPGDPGRSDVEEIERAAERATQLTRGLLAFSRQAEAHPTPVDLAAVVRDEVPLLRRLVGEHIVVELDTPTDAPTALVDRAQIEQILLNFAANGRDAMPNGGTLRVAVEAATLSDAFVALHPGAQAGEHVLLTVSDTGVGMDEATQAHLFEPFFTTKPRGQGTGLGLASIYGIVKQASGYIHVESRPGAGSSFRVYFPAIQGARPEAVPQPVAVDSPGAGTETILLVEDDPAVRLFAERVLKDCGYRVLAFADPALALDAAIGDPGRFDALITDVVMPAMSGPAVAERIDALRPGLPVLFMSGYEAGILPAGAPQPLAKPFSARELADSVGGLFGRRP